MENYNILGNKFGRVSDNSQAIHYYLEAFEHCKRSDKQRSLPDICTNIADTYIRTGDFVNGVKFYQLKSAHLKKKRRKKICSIRKSSYFCTAKNINNIIKTVLYE